MPKFNDSENRVPFAPEGDYSFTVVDFESRVSQGPKTAGADVYGVTLKLEKPGNECTESLIDHPTCNWKLDCFLKCCGIKLAKGEGYEFSEGAAKAKGVRFINPLGLRGWARFTIREYKRQDNTMGKANAVATFYTDKEKLPPVVIAEEDKPF